MRKRQYFRKTLQENNQRVQFYTVASHAPMECQLVNLSAGGVALRMSAEEHQALNLRQGDIVYVNLKGLGIRSSGIAAKVTRVDQGGKHAELGISFVSSSQQFQHEVESLIGWRQLKSSLNRPRASAAPIYSGEKQATTRPKWLEALFHSLGRRSETYMRVENPIQPKSHLIEWIESSVDKEQLGVSLTQSL